MDDECVEELGRPISSLKVSELRDELAKRALIKTGKKNELIDRLRQAITKKVSSSHESSATPADIAQSDSDAQMDSAIDYSTPNISGAAPTHQQASLVTADVVDYSISDKNHDERLEQNDSVHEEEDRKEDSIPDTPELPAQNNAKHVESSEQQASAADGNEQERKRHDEVDEDRGRTDSQNQQENGVEKTPAQSERPRSVEPVDDKVELSHDGPSDSMAAETQITEVQSSTDVLADIKGKPAQDSEPVAPVTFTLKRGNRESSGSRAEKRRKWSGKTSEPCQSSDSSLVSGGISSQKLQELIDLQQSEVNETSKSTPPKDSTAQVDDKPSESDTPVEKETEEVAETADMTSDGKVDSVKQKTNDEAKSESSREPLKSNTDQSSLDDAKTEEPTNWLVIKNLMRPYTVSQLKEELTKFGPIVEEKFWTDKVKSKCCVLYESIDAAQQTRQSMQGQHWPISNPKSLIVDFITEEQYNEHIEADARPPPTKTKKKEETNKPVNGGPTKQTKQTNNRLADRLETSEAGGSSLEQRLGVKVGSDAKQSKSNKSEKLDLINAQPKELDELFRKTRANPQLFWLPLNEEQAEARTAERLERDKRAQELSQNASRRSPPAKRRPGNDIRRSPARHRSPRRSPIRRRSPAPRRRTPPPPGRRSPPRRRAPPSPKDSPSRRRSPPRNSPPRRRSPGRGSPPRRWSPSRDSPPRRRSPPRNSPPRRRSPLRDSPPRRRSPPRNSPPRRRSPPRESPLLRRKPSPGISPPPIRRRSPQRDSPPFRRRTPVRHTPPIRRRSPSPLLRRRTPPRDSPPIRRRSPEPGRRSPEAYNRRSPRPMRRVSPGRRSPVMLRRSPDMMRRSPMRRSPGLMNRSPEPIRRSPVLRRRSPGPIGHSPIALRRSPGPIRRSPVPVRRPRGNRDYYN